MDTANTEDFTHRTEYDKLNRPVKQFQPYDPADSDHNTGDIYTETVYDEVGRVARTSLPPAGEAEVSTPSTPTTTTVGSRTPRTRGVSRPATTTTIWAGRRSGR
ncbi:hypothetical protein [Streptomyces sp. NPDC018833]|uniref:hypothetical protein n=1 Tax=Streptomyces sp. NPDC018833 TaxID=3365053 RepID=UPI00379F5A60